ncbi:MAG TPA: toluene-4-monooxygenase system B family protein [Candidatus Binatia bacterium]|jgi:toluene monooxygenase system protein B|nr:toluene-4-monooxygenase system B family protein [Candidatus Binatia bacterium]
MAADFPVGVAVQGDYETRLVMIEPDATMDDLCAAVAPFVVGRFVPEQPDKTMRIKHQNNAEPFPRDARVKDVLVPWDPVELLFL